eukprot:g9131.t1 g9131   contig35:103283-103977(+)
MKVSSLLLLSGVVGVNSWSLNNKSSNRPPLSHQLQKATAATALATSLLLPTTSVVNAIDFSGSYSDPGHPSCARVIKMEGSTAVISGVDGNPGCGVGSVQGAEWKLTGRVDEKDANEIFVDFSSKGGPKDLVGKWDENGIRWPDGNKWTRQ